MRFKLWIYKSSGHVTVAVEDTANKTYGAGSWKMRDQSNYEAGKMVWKNAAHPAAVERAKDEAEGFVIAEAECISLLNANIDWKVLKRLWSEHEQ